MKDIIILGAGRVGSLVSCLLVESGDYIVHLLDKHIPDDKPVLERNIDNLKYVELDVTKTTELQKYVKQHNAKSIVSCLPFFLNKSIAKLAGELGLNYFDLTEDVEATDYIKSIAENSKNNFFAPQCGLAPGFISIVSNNLMQEFDSIDTVRMRVGALPLNVSNTLQYALTWSTEGLINEYAKPCEGIVDGEKRTLAPLADIEEIKINGLTYEAFNTSGGIGSMIDTYAGKVKNINYKTIRYPGHCEKMKFLMQDMKLGEDLETMVKIMERALPRINQDVVLIYVSVDGVRKGLKAERHFAQKYPSKVMFGKYFSALQLTTATSLCVSIDLLLNAKEQPRGFINQESICLKDFYNNRFGQYYKKSGLLIQAD
ncbi:saccharopine dehydrogenase NADP-binding domain-containing protein [Francisella tularensis subsp. novicida]|uniref:Dehydrogenase n=3 Tax=Francisella tularensis TaxID=263 RepID=A0A6I4RL58_FRATU|nr:saccharopine dehydrogenase C-terminal domain-containing protein [Francisella tularensis]ABK89852.1 dehydrogenase [Francisella tularensis subsp. novicida U112]AJI45977.1 saccharopine dehydrogenase family protein [Francisella tularensis subsp. novicida F6168]AJI61887.1 saccharopine dehydrogenase family protein [Francisella tularensis subsp. novicida U112]AJI72337.1 saccharopine dehydrogenase family protein [Francisella tularensis subsp. novicida D9876]AJJ47631.1 saccharopine dehydrogenase fam